MIHCYLSSYDGLGITVIVIVYHEMEAGELIHCYLPSYESSGIRVIVIVYYTMEARGIDTLISVIL